MIRLLPLLVLFFVPFLGYALLLHVQEENPFLRASWKKHPLIWLCVSGVAMVVIGVLTVGLTGNHPENSIYVPARMENGVLIPGEVRRGPPPRPAPGPGSP